MILIIHKNHTCYVGIIHWACLMRLTGNIRLIWNSIKFPSLFKTTPWDSFFGKCFQSVISHNCNYWTNGVYNEFLYTQQTFTYTCIYLLKLQLLSLWMYIRMVLNKYSVGWKSSFFLIFYHPWHACVKIDGFFWK